MSEQPYNSKQREPEIASKQELLQQLEKHVKYLREVNKTLVKIERNVAEMNEYYFGEWMNDYDNFSSDKTYNVLDQDHIHDALYDIHCEKIKLLKKIVSKLQ